ncbi:hypothetical protein [Cellulosimicrobium aquatile]|uniref:hypothetical protein n=1 Tax=Cellulosimicrobium aquatile TaxID=1612203 RepID=UPI001459C253|nr:hypothetical protein [Cellulosimicrobium aquatile]NMF28352.1 hypothetical protein [Cellulosimicrobium aquatile]
MQVYATAPDIIGLEPGVQWLMTTIDHTSLTDVLRFATPWVARGDAAGPDWKATDRAFVTSYMRDDALERAEEILGDPRRRIVVPQALLVLIKIALFRSGTAERQEAAVDQLPAALLSVASGLNGSGPGASRDDIVGEMVANQNFNNSPDIATLLSLYQARWNDQRGLTGSKSPSHTYEDEVGLPLDDLASIVLSIWARCHSGGLPFIESDLMSQSNLDPKIVARALDLLSATPDDLRDAIDEAEISTTTPWNSVPWTFSTFERFPLISHDGGWYVVSPRFLLNRIFSWLPVFDVKSALLARGCAAEAARFENDIRQASENYVQDSIASTYEQLPGRVYTEVELRAELGSRSKVADLAIDYGHSWVVAEISTRRLLRESAEGGAGLRLEDEIEAMCRKFLQIDASIKRIRETRFRDNARNGANYSVRFYPILILTEGYPVNPLILDRLHEVLRLKSILIGRDTANAEVIDLGDLEMIESLATSGGPTIIDILNSKQSGLMRLADVTSHIRSSMRLSPPRPAYVADAAHSVLASAVDRFQP